MEDSKLKIVILTGRTIDQGCGKEIGKASKEYVDSVAICEMNEEDMKNLGVKDGERVKVTTEFGSVVLTAKKSRRIRSPGAAFMPYGPWANFIMGSNTDGTGMPLLKGISASIERTDEEVPSIKELYLRE
jgi:formylmethanofuran dehydrogenase subunit D